MKFLKLLIVCTLYLSICYTTETGNENVPCKEYPLTTVVTETGTKEIVVTDFNGNDWIYETDDEWEIGDYCSMIMSDNGTESIYDDIIVNVRYNGYLQGKWADKIER